MCYAHSIYICTINPIIPFPIIYENRRLKSIYFSILVYMLLLFPALADMTVHRQGLQFGLARIQFSFHIVVVIQMYEATEHLDSFG